MKGIFDFALPEAETFKRIFLGLIGYCNKWVPNFSLTAQPFYALLRSDNLTQSNGLHKVEKL